MATIASNGPTSGLVDTNVIFLRAKIDPTELPDALAISTITLAELSAGIPE